MVAGFVSAEALLLLTLASPNDEFLLERKEMLRGGKIQLREIQTKPSMTGTSMSGSMTVETGTRGM